MPPPPCEIGCSNSPCKIELMLDNKKINVERFDNKTFLFFRKIETQHFPPKKLKDNNSLAQGRI